RSWQDKRNHPFLPRPIRDLRAPPTWEEFAQQAEFFHETDGKPSLPPLPESEGELDRLFFTVAASYARRAASAPHEKRAKDHLDETFSFHSDRRTGDPRIDGPGFVEALALLQRLQRCRPKGTSARPESAAFERGEAVLCLTEATALVDFQKQAALRDRF